MRIPNRRLTWVLFAAGWLLTSLALLALSLFSSFQPGLVAELYWCAVVVLSPIAFTAFGWDKWKAKQESRRIPEKTLHLLAILGGWPGAVLGQQMFRHKTVKPVFRSILVAIGVAHIAVCAWWYFGSDSSFS